jgi:hypothetical protein
LTVLFAATVAVLLIVCVNLANLLLARLSGRRRDAAVRTALGAGRGALVIDSLVESLLLALGGGALGAAVAWIVTRVIIQTAPAALPMLNTFELNAPVLLFSLASTLVVGVAIGLLPAWRIGQVDPGDVLKANSYSTTDSPRGGRARQPSLVPLRCWRAPVQLAAPRRTRPCARFCRNGRAPPVRQVVAALAGAHCFRSDVCAAVGKSAGTFCVTPPVAAHSVPRCIETI